MSPTPSTTHPFLCGLNTRPGVEGDTPAIPALLPPWDPACSPLPSPGPAADLALSCPQGAGVTAASPPLLQRPVSAEREGALLALPVVVGLINLGAPYLYRCLAALERHDSPVLEVYVAICRCVAGGGFLGCSLCLPGTPPSVSAPPLFHRNLILKMVVLGILCYHWLGRRVGALKDQVRVGRAGLEEVGGSLCLRRVCPGPGVGGNEHPLDLFWPGSPRVGWARGPGG